MTTPEVNPELLQENGGVAKTYVFNSKSEEEQRRLREQHNILLKLVDGRYILAPLKETPKSVLELATGTGIWAAEYAKLHPETSILGVDLVDAVQPGMPTNFSYRQLDLGAPSWDLGQQFDLVHAKLLFSIPLDFPHVMRQAFAALKPGGWYECKEYLMPTRSDNDCAGTAFAEAQVAFMEALAAIGQDWTVAGRFDGYMRDAGFVDVHYETFKVPLGGWSEDPKLKEVGEWYSEYARQYEPLMHIAFSKGLGWDKQRTDKLITGSRYETSVAKTVHGWHEYRVIYGRKPE